MLSKNLWQSRLAQGVLWMTLHHALCGFVLLSARKATLSASPDTPTVNFSWDGEAPSIKEKEKYRGGAYANLSDAEMMRRLLVDAMELWNSVPGAFIVLNLAETTSPVKLDSKDKQNSIVVASSDNVTSAAFALPDMPDDGNVITDCDVSIAKRSVEAQSLIYTLTHELGHCLGLGHAHTNYNAIMGYSRSRRDLALGADDIAGLIHLYPDPKYGDMDPKSKICGVAGTSSASSMGWVALLVLPLVLAGRRFFPELGSGRTGSRVGR